MAGLIEHRIPDVVSTADLPVVVAAEIDFLAGRVDRWLEQSSRVSAAVSARSLAFARCSSDSRSMLETLDVSALGPTDLAAAAWAASRVGGAAVATLLARLESDRGEFVGGDVPVGPRRLYTGMLHGALGDVAAAVSELTAAREIGDARAPLWGAQCRLELGRVLRTAGAIPMADLPASGPTLTAARTFFAAGGYRSLLARVELAGEPVDAALGIGQPSWVGFGVEPAVAIRPSKGLTAIRYLIDNQHRVVSAAELACIVDGGDAARVAAWAPEAWTSGRGYTDTPTGDVTETIRRIFFDDTVRSRLSKLLRRTIMKLSESHTLVAAHLDAAIVTGHGCRYRPTGSAVRWGLGELER